MKKLAPLAAALALGLALGTTALAQQTIRMGTEGAYPPYNFINDNGEVDGFEREFGDKVCELAGFTCTWVTNEWDSIIPNLVSGNYDTIVAGMSITDERDEVIDFTQAYIPSDPSAYMALAGTGDDAVNGVVAAQTSTIQASHVTTTDATLVEFASPDDTIAAVRNGEVDAVLADRAFLEPIVAESNGELIFIGEDVDIANGIGMGLRESDGETRAAFDAAITQLKEDGSLNVMLKKWFGEDTRTW